MNTILDQPYRRRVSTDRLNREDAQLAASLESESGPTRAGKILPHMHTPKPGFGERGYGMCVQQIVNVLPILPMYH